MSPYSRVHVDVAAFHEAGHALVALKEKRQVSFIGASHKYPGDGDLTSLR